MRGHISILKRMTLPSSITTSIQTSMDELIDNFDVLRKQEMGMYQCRDYLSPDHQAGLEQKVHIQSHIHTSSSAFDSYSCMISSESGAITVVWRDMFCDWAFKAIDYFELKREVASISLNYLDRYLYAHAVDMNTFKLAAMTSLLLAIKLYETMTTSISSFININCGNFETEHIALMENSMLCTLSWLVHPPTPLNFVRIYTSLLEENGCASTVSLEIEEVAQFLTESSVCDYYFTTRKPSSIALGAIRTAFSNIGEIPLPSYVCHIFFERVRTIAGIDPFSSEVEECSDRFSTTCCFPDTGYPQKQRDGTGGLIDTGHFSPSNIVDVDTYIPNKKLCGSRR